MRVHCWLTTRETAAVMAPDQIISKRDGYPFRFAPIRLIGRGIKTAASKNKNAKWIGKPL